MPADILNESFNAAGYDSPTWSETVGSGSVCDEDNTDIADSAGGSTQILKIQKVSPNWAAWTRRTLAGDNAITYSQFYVYVASEGLANTNILSIAVARDSTTKETWSIRLYQDGSGNLVWNMYRYTGGAATDCGVYPAAATGQWYKHEVKYDGTNDLWEWRINGASIASGALADTHSAGIYDVRLGSFAADATANTYYIDALKISSTGYPVDRSLTDIFSIAKMSGNKNGMGNIDNISTWNRKKFEFKENEKWQEQYSRLSRQRKRLSLRQAKNALYV